MKEYWNSKPMAQTSTTSQRELERMKKYWANADDLYLDDFKDKHAQATKEYSKKGIKDGVTDKINHNGCPLLDKALNFKHNAGAGSWATQESSRKIMKSIYDVEGNERPSLQRYLDSPMYSSFSPSHEFAEKRMTSSMVYIIY